jgi:4-nitrophenyl phosphatase
VIWSGSSAISHVPETINWLKNTRNSNFKLLNLLSNNFYFLVNKRCLFLTNNATKSRDSYLKKFNDIGIQISKVNH